MRQKLAAALLQSIGWAIGSVGVECFMPGFGAGLVVFGVGVVMAGLAVEKG